jgi:hypothetical protein
MQSVNTVAEFACYRPDITQKSIYNIHRQIFTKAACVREEIDGFEPKGGEDPLDITRT